MRYLKYFEGHVPNLLDTLVNKFTSAEDFAKAFINGYTTSINFRDLSVDMKYLRIAEEDLNLGKESVTPNDPVDVTYNVSTNKAYLLDGYHRYLKARGGTIENALKQSRNNIFGDILCNIKIIKDYHGKTGIKNDEYLNMDELMELYNKYQ